MELEAAVCHTAASKQIRMLQHFSEGQLQRERTRGRDLVGEAVRAIDEYTPHNMSAHHIAGKFLGIKLS